MECNLSYGFEFNLELICTSEFFKKLKLHEPLRRVNFAFWKTHKCKLIPNWTRTTVWLLINNINMKKMAWRMFWTVFKNGVIVVSNCFELVTLFSVLCARLTSGNFNYHAIRKNCAIIAPSRARAWFENKKFDWLSVNFFVHWPIRMLALLPFFCIQLPLFCIVLRKNCTVLSQSDSSNFFMYIIRSEITSMSPGTKLARPGVQLPLKHGAILYNEAEVFSLSITNPNGRPMLPFDWLIQSSLI